MKFKFTATIDSPSMLSVFHLQARECHADYVEFELDNVNAYYEGSVDDPTFLALAELFEEQPEHQITLSTH